MKTILHKTGLPLLAAAVSACATVPAPPGPVQRLATGELLGLSANEIRGHLGFSPSGVAYVSEIRETGQGLITVLSQGDVTAPGAPCPAGQTRVLGTGRGLSRFIFRDGKLAAVEAAGPGGVMSEIAQLTATCRAGPRQTKDAAVKGTAEAIALLTMMGPFLAVGLAQDARDQHRRRGQAKIAARLRLGDPPPGGLDAYAANPPKRVQVVRTAPQDADIADITVSMGSLGYSYETVIATVRRGRITALEKRSVHPCVLKDGALHC